MTSQPLFVVLGWDVNAMQAVKRLLDLDMEISVVNPLTPAGLPERVKAVPGRPDDTEHLVMAGIRTAAGILACLPADDAGRAITAARRLNPGIHVVASVQREDSKSSLLAAGAQQAVDAREEACREMVRLMLSKPPSSEG